MYKRIHIESGLATLGTGVTIAYSQCFGIVQESNDKFKMSMIICAISHEQARKNQ